MKGILKGLAIVAVCTMVLASVLFYAGTIDLEALKMILLILTIVWFVVAPMAWRETKTA